jgi:hypothetical protein
VAPRVPQHPLRDLTPEELARHPSAVKFEAYPENPAGGLVGRFWTQEELDAAGVTP